MGLIIRIYNDSVLGKKVERTTSVETFAKLACIINSYANGEYTNFTIKCICDDSEEVDGVFYLMTSQNSDNTYKIILVDEKSANSSYFIDYEKFDFDSGKLDHCELEDFIKKCIYINYI